MSGKIYPTKENIVLLLADEALPQEGNKFSINGLMVSPKIFLPETEPFDGLVLRSLAVMFITRDGLGVFDGKISVDKPSDKLLMEEQVVSKSTIFKNEYHVKATVFTPFLVPEFGYYTFRLTLDSTKYEYAVYIGNQAAFSQESHTQFH